MLSEIVFFLLRQGAHREPKRITTNEVAQNISVSQQTASRKLINLEKSGPIILFAIIFMEYVLHINIIFPIIMYAERFFSSIIASFITSLIDLVKLIASMF